MRQVENDKQIKEQQENQQRESKKQISKKQGDRKQENSTPMQENSKQESNTQENRSKKEKLSKQSNNKKILKRLFHYIGKYWFLMALSIILAAVYSLLSLYLPVLIGKAVDFIVDKGQVDFDGLLQVLVRMAIFIGIAALAQWVMNVCNNKITFDVVRDIRKEAFDKIEHLPLAYIDAHPSGEIVSRVIADVDQFADGLLLGFTQFFTGILTILGTLYFMLTINKSITLVVVLITPLSLFVAAFIAKSTYTMFKKQSETRGEQTTLIDEMIGNQKVVQAFSHEDEAMEEFDEINERLQKCSLKAIFFSSTTNPSTRFINGLVYTGVALTGALAAMKGRLTIGQLTSFLSYANQYTKPFNEISGVVTELQNALACAGRIFELIDEPSEIPDAEDAKILESPSGEIDLEKVWFSYTDQQKLIEDFNLHVKPGQRVAIVGPTGCGKTTIINLLMRFYDVKEGKIRVEGEDIRDYTRKSLRTNYGMVLQETWMKAGTIRENICMGKPEATEEEMIAAAKAAHAHSFIKRLPKGYDTVIGEDGGTLSQGQKQLLCITRVMLCLPPMLILDEATSSIDTRTEMKIQNAFQTMMQGRTSFIVAHRLSTIQEADIILVMKDGHIIEQGNHESLMKQHGFYEQLHKAAQMEG